MKQLFEATRYLALIAVIVLLIAAIAAFFNSGALLVRAVQALLVPGTTQIDPTIALINLIDACLIAASLLIFSLTLYELFVGDLALPDWLVIKSFSGLKSLLVSLVVLIMAVKFTSKFVEGKDSADVLSSAVAVAVVVAALTFFSRYADKDKDTAKEPKA
jgi:uncharacterized membrane protein YqhA